MKSNNDRLDPVVGVGFCIILLSSCFTGAAALKVLFTDLTPSPQIELGDISVIENRCWLFCSPGGK